MRPATEKPARPFSRRQNRELALGLLALGVIVAAISAGEYRERRNHQNFIYQVFPNASQIEQRGNNVFAAYSGKPERQSLGYLAWATRDGYAGPIKVALQTDPTGRIDAVLIVSQHETPSFFDRIRQHHLLEQFFGKTILEKTPVTDTIDAVSGATRTSCAIIEATQAAAENIATTIFDRKAPHAQTPNLYIGVPEIVLLALFVTALAGLYTRGRLARRLRWASMLVGLFILGFAYNQPLNLVFVNRLLMGHWPAWQSYLYWYLLTGAIILVVAINGHNLYCTWICPFGAIQECFGLIGGTKFRLSQTTHRLLRWMQRSIAVSAIALALVYRNPSLSSYEVFAALFALIGTTVQYCLLAAVMITALFIYRPWCHTLCPIRPLVDLVRLFATRLKVVLHR